MEHSESGRRKAASRSRGQIVNRERPVGTPQMWAHSQGQLQERTYTDEKGRQWVVLVPENETDYSIGIPLGPPDLSALNLPEAIEIALHNQLTSRRLFTQRDVRHRMNEIQAALQAAYRVDAGRIMALYQ